MHKHTMLDAGESIFFARELEFVKSKTYDIKYANLKARQLFPVSYDAGPGAETITYEQYDAVGLAKVIASYADDLPRADVKGKQFTSLVKSLGSSYGYSIQEIRAAQLANKPLKQNKANAAKRAIMLKENQLAFAGDSAFGIVGFINNPNISTTTLPADGTGSLTTWASKTPALILRDMHKVSNYVIENTMEVETPDTMLLPLAKFNYIKSTPWSTGNDGRTILDLFLQQNNNIKEVIPVIELAGAGAGATDRMIVYRKDPDALQMEIPQDFEQLEEEKRNLEYVVACHERFGGVNIYYPLSVAYADGL